MCLQCKLGVQATTIINVIGFLFTIKLLLTAQLIFLNIGDQQHSHALAYPFGF